VAAVVVEAGAGNPAFRTTPGQTRQSRALPRRSWHHIQFFPAATPSPYLNTARYVARKEIASAAQAQNAVLSSTKPGS
jgi:hypothetical protein